MNFLFPLLHVKSNSNTIWLGVQLQCLNICLVLIKNIYLCIYLFCYCIQITVICVQLFCFIPVVVFFIFFCFIVVIWLMYKYKLPVLLLFAVLCDLFHPVHLLLWDNLLWCRQCMSFILISHPEQLCMHVSASLISPLKAVYESVWNLYHFACVWLLRVYNLLHRICYEWSFDQIWYEWSSDSSSNVGSSGVVTSVSNNKLC